MKLQIVETSDYILALSDEEIKKGDWYLTFTNNVVMGCPRKCEDSNWNFSHCKKIVAHLPKNNSPELDLPLLPEIVVEDNVEKLCWGLFGGSFEARGVESEEEADRVVSFGIECYKSATKVYSEDDLRKAFEAGMYFIGEDKGSYEEFIQSLKQPKTPKWFVAEKEYLSNDGNWKNVLLPSEWEVDTQFRYRTTATNGKTYLIGTYEY
jgi:hypothetical protein